MSQPPVCCSQGPYRNKDGAQVACTRPAGHAPPCGVGRSTTVEWHLLATLRALLGRRA